MTETRSFAPRTEAEGQAPPPTFPLLPYACMAYAEQCSRDYVGYVDSLTQVEEPPAAAESALQMLTDMNQAFYALVWAPMGAALGRAQP